MSRFRTIVNIPVSTVKINYHTPCMFMGSCFADNIGAHMTSLKFPVLLNPFGTLFNPVSISDNLLSLLKAQSFSHDDLHQHNGLWFSFSYYTKFSHPDADTCLASVNRARADAAAFLKSCRFLVLTFGTARVFTFSETGRVVANCHKLPAAAFSERVVEPVEIVDIYTSLLNDLASFNPDLQVIFTVSPVRHLKEGAVNNQRSKSVLLLAIHELLKKHSNTHYFPAYEIFMDELRDYRFYAADMLHPSEQGVAYVWERFCDTWLGDEAKKPMTGVATLLKATAHRPLQTETTNLKKFQENTLKQIQQLTREHPYLDFSAEIALLSPP